MEKRLNSLVMDSDVLILKTSSILGGIGWLGSTGGGGGSRGVRLICSLTNLRAWRCNTPLSAPARFRTHKTRTYPPFVQIILPRLPRQPHLRSTRCGRRSPNDVGRGQTGHILLWLRESNRQVRLRASSGKLHFHDDVKHEVLDLADQCHCA